MVSLYRERRFSASNVSLVIAAVTLSFFLAIIVRLFFIQVVAHGYYQDLADAQQTQRALVSGTRGQIFAHDHTNAKSDELYPLAVNKEFYEIYINPTEVARPQNTAQKLSEILGVDYKKVLERAKKEKDVYEPIASKVSEEERDRILSTGLPGIYARKETWRFYPDREVGSHVIGFLGVDPLRVGKYGIEGYWEDELAGKSERSIIARDATGEVIPAYDGTISQTSLDGSDLVLTIDRTIQFEVCRSLKQGMEKYAADKGTVIVMETTGKILALCNYPSFDPNEYQRVPDVRYFNNDAVFEAYEPGSVFKPVAMGIAIDQGKVTPETVYEDSGAVTIEDRTIRNFDQKAYGTRTMTEVLQLSLNTGIVFATKNVSNQVYYDYIKKFGFGEKTSVEMSQEVAGSLGQLAKARDIYKATTSYGQGISVTPLQMLNAINALANDGVLVRPFIVDEVRKPNGQVVRTQPRTIRRVVSSETAQTITAMLVRVTEEGYDHKASVPGYYLAGKTGTAQIAEGGKYTDTTNHTFVGYGPANDPRFSVILKLYNVKNVKFAADSTTPIFNEIARFLLQYYKIAPNR